MMKQNEEKDPKYILVPCYINFDCFTSFWMLSILQEHMLLLICLIKWI